MMSTALCLEWKNLELNVKINHLDVFKLKARVEEKQILSNGAYELRYPSQFDCQEKK